MSLKIDTEDQKPPKDNTNSMLSSPPSKTYTSLSPQIPSSSMISKAVPPTTQTSPGQTSKNFKVRMLCLLCLVGKKGKSIQIIRSIKRRTIMRI